MKKNIAPQQLGCIFSMFALVLLGVTVLVYFAAENKKAQYEQQKQNERTYQTVNPNAGMLE